MEYNQAKAILLEMAIAETIGYQDSVEVYKQIDGDSFWYGDVCFYANCGEVTLQELFHVSSHSQSEDIQKAAKRAIELLRDSTTAYVASRQAELKNKKG